MWEKGSRVYFKGGWRVRGLPWIDTTGLTVLDRSNGIVLLGVCLDVGIGLISGKPVALAVEQVEKHEAHDGSEEEKEGREYDPGPAEAREEAFFRSGWAPPFTALGERRIASVERKDVFGIDFVQIGGGRETGRGDGGFRDWRILEWTGSRMAEIREERVS